MNKSKGNIIQERTNKDVTSALNTSWRGIFLWIGRDIKNGGTIVIQIQISRLAFIIYFWHHINRWCHTPIAFPERWHVRLSTHDGGACVNLANEFNIAGDETMINCFRVIIILNASFMHWKDEYIDHIHLRSFWASVPNTSNHLFVCSVASLICCEWCRIPIKIVH